MAKKRKSSGRRETQVPGQFYGYSIQITRMLARLLRCHAGQAVSLEVLGDVAVHSPTGILSSEESKSGLAHNPISDRAVDIWKTLFNWVEAIRAGVLGSDVRFVLYVAQPYEGNLVCKLDEVSDQPRALALVQEIRNEFWGKEPEYPKKEQIAETIAPYVNGVLSASDDVLIRLIVNFELETGSGSPGDDLRQALRERTISEAAVDGVLEHLLGWVKQTVDKLIEQGRPAIITWEEFDKKIVAAAKRFDRSQTLSPTPTEITEKEVNHELRNRMYVRQLQLIDAQDDELVSAVNDYLRASADRTSWSERGDVLEPSFYEFADKLRRHWETRKQLAKVELAGRTEMDIGKVVHAHCMALQVKLQGMDVPGYFAPGSYHALADNLKVGWHPRFDTLLGTTHASTPPNDSPSGSDNDEKETL